MHAGAGKWTVRENRKCRSGTTDFRSCQCMQARTLYATTPENPRKVKLTSRSSIRIASNMCRKNSCASCCRKPRYWSYLRPMVVKISLRSREVSIQLSVNGKNRLGIAQCHGNGVPKRAREMGCSNACSCNGDERRRRPCNHSTHGAHTIIFSGVGSAMVSRAHCHRVSPKSIDPSWLWISPHPCTAWCMVGDGECRRPREGASSMVRACYS